MQKLNKSIHTVHALDKYPAFQREARTLILYTTWIKSDHQRWINKFGTMLDTGEIIPMELDAEKSSFGRVYPVLAPYEEKLRYSN